MQIFKFWQVTEIWLFTFGSCVKHLERKTQEFTAVQAYESFSNWLGKKETEETIVRCLNRDSSKVEGAKLLEGLKLTRG